MPAFTLASYSAIGPLLYSSALRVSNLFLYTVFYVVRTISIFRHCRIASDWVHDRPGGKPATVAISHLPVTPCSHASLLHSRSGSALETGYSPSSKTTSGTMRHSCKRAIALRGNSTAHLDNVRVVLSPENGTYAGYQFNLSPKVCYRSMKS